MKILLIIAQYHPAVDPNIQRWTKLLTLFKKQGDEPFVLTTQLFPEASRSELDDVIVYRTGHQTLKDAWYNTLGKENKRNKSGSSSFKRSTLNIITDKIVNVLWRKNYWPDGSVLFLKPGKKLGEEIVSKHKIDSIISVGTPFSCHLIAQYLKEIFPTLHWHMDIQDPFSFSKEFRVNNFKKYQTRNVHAESLALQTADTISVNNEVAKSLYIDNFPFIQNKIALIPPLFSIPHDIESLELDLKKDKLNLAYFGSFYERVRSPEPLLEFMTKFKSVDPDNYSKIRIHFMGKHSPFSLGLFDKFKSVSDDIKQYGMINRPYLFSLINKMDALIHIGNTTNYHLPSKAVEYLYFNKPIINFRQIPDDSFEKFIDDRCKIFRLTPNTKIDLELISAMLHFVEENKSDKRTQKSLMQKYTIDKIGLAYKTMMNNQNSKVH